MVDKVRMYILKDLGRELRKVEDGFVRSEHNMKGHFFSCCGDEALEE